MPQTLLFQLHTLTYELDAIAQKFLKAKYNLSFNQFVILLGVLRYEQTNQKTLELFSLLSNAAVSKIISQLELKQLIRKSNLTNMRDSSIALTDAGILLMSKAISDMENISKKFFPDKDSDEYSQLSNSILKILFKLNSTT